MNLILKAILITAMLFGVAKAQTFNLKLSSTTIYNDDNKQVNGYYDGREFIRTQDISEQYSKILLQRLHIKGVVNGAILEVLGKSKYRFELEAETNEEYKFKGTLGDIVLQKDLSQLVIMNRRVDKYGREFYYMAVFGKPL